MRKYDSYKDSGVEWIGEIPSHWEILKFGYLGKLKSGNGFPEKLQGREFGGDFPFFKVSDTNNEGNEIEMSVSNNYVTKEEFETNNWTLFSENTIVFPKIGMGLLLNKRRILNQPSIIDNNMMGFTPNKRIDLKYSFYLLKLIDFKDYCSEGTVPSIGESQISPIKINLPPLSEQNQIVSYLDRKTSQIDTLIEKTQRKIELLKEKRTALINEVVTKGLNPNVEMKDGVEWIGEIPRHWELRKGSTIGNYSKGNGIKKDEVRETGLPCIRYGEIYTKYNHKFDRVETFIDEGITDVKVSYGTLFMTGSGELLEDIGKCVVYVGNEELYVGGDIIILKPFTEFDSEFLSYQINSECLRIQRELNGRGGIIVHIYSKNFKDMWFPTPPLSEQIEIVSYLDEHTQLIYKTVSIEERRIELLKEYRQSLISEVVTGKRKVVNDA